MVRPLVMTGFDVWTQRKYFPGMGNIRDFLEFTGVFCSSLAQVFTSWHREASGVGRGGFRDLQKMLFRGDDCISGRRSALSEPFANEECGAAESGTGDRGLPRLRIFTVHDRAGMVIGGMAAGIPGQAREAAEGTSGLSQSKHY